MDANIKAVTIIVSVVLILTAGCSDSQYSSRKSYSSSAENSDVDYFQGQEFHPLVGFYYPETPKGQKEENQGQEPKPLNYDPLVDAPPKLACRTVLI